MWINATAKRPLSFHVPYLKDFKFILLNVDERLYHLR